MNHGRTSTIDQRPLRRALIALGITQIVSWGVLYYAFPVALASITAGTGWSSSACTAAFSASLVVSAVAGVPAGRWLDRFGPRRVMTCGSILAVPAVVVIALAPNLPLFFAGWVLAGAAQAAILYQAAFAALTRWYGPRRVSAITTLTLVAGLSSTLFAPLTSLLLRHLDWRGTYLVLATVLAAVTIPAHAWLLTPPWHPPTAAGAEPRRRADRAGVRQIVRSSRFLVLSGALTVANFGVYAASLTLIPLLTGRGMSPTAAATTLGLVGAGQLLGRLGYAPLNARATPAAASIVILGACAVTVALLGAVPGPTAALVALSVLLGAARGAATLLQATTVADIWGTTQYATLAGYFAAPITLATAVAPWGGTVLAGVFGGYPIMFAVLAAGTAAATIGAGLFNRKKTPRTSDRLEQTSTKG